MGSAKLLSLYRSRQTATQGLARLMRSRQPYLRVSFVLPDCAGRGAGQDPDVAILPLFRSTKKGGRSTTTGSLTRDTGGTPLRRPPKRDLRGSEGCQLIRRTSKMCRSQAVLTYRAWWGAHSLPDHASLPTLAYTTSNKFLFKRSEVSNKGPTKDTPREICTPHKSVWLSRRASS